MKKVVIAAALASFVAAPAFAQQQQTAPAAAAPAKPAASTPAPMDKSMSMDKKAKSADCAKQADAKGLHGKARKKFRSECKKG